MNQTSYAVHAIEDLEFLAERSKDVHTSKLCLASIAQIHGSQIFKVPDNGLVIPTAKNTAIDAVIRDYAQPFRLPYETICVEFDADCNGSGSGELFTRTLALAAEVKCGERIGIVVSCVYFPSAIKHWIPANYSVMLFDDGSYNVLAMTKDGMTLGPAHALTDLQLEVQAVVLLIACLSCQNVTHVVIDPPSKLNKARVKRGKLPFFSYHVLTIDREVHDGGNADENGTHASPRVHLRRGHIRRLPDKRVWVNACVVGDKSLGMVSKDYRVTSGAAV